MGRARKIAGEPYKRGNVYWAKIHGVRKSLGISDEKQAVAYCAKLNYEAVNVTKLDAIPKRSWQDAVIQRRKELVGCAELENQIRYFNYWDKYLSRVDDLNLITPEYIEECILKDRGIDADEPPESPLLPNIRCPGNATANYYVKCVQTILNKAAGVKKRDWKWGVKPQHLNFYPTTEGRQLALTPVDVHRRAELLPRHSRDIMLYAVATMQRRANITGLRWDWIDIPTAMLFIPADASKNGQSQVIPLNSFAMAIIKRRAISIDRHPEYVFHYQGAKIKQVVTKTWRDAMAEAGELREKVLLHTMRHTGASWLMLAQANDATVRWLGGWKLPSSLGAMRRYLHANAEKLRPISELIAVELERGWQEWQSVKHQADQVISDASRALDVVCAEIVESGTKNAQSLPLLKLEAA